MKEHMESRIISLNSKDAYEPNNNDYRSDVVFRFKSLLSQDDHIIRTTLGVISVEIPNSTYNVNESHNELYFKIDETYYTMTIPVGNYKATSMKFIFEKLFKQLTGFQCVLLFNTSLGKFSLSINTPVTIYKKESTISNIIGITKDTMFETDVPTFFQNPCNFIGIKKIKIFSQALSTTAFDSNIMGNNTMIQTIPVTVPPFGILIYQNSHPMFSIISATSIGEIDIQIKDENGDLIDF